MTFDKELFAELLSKAKGDDRSINKYAAEIDISPAHISRLLRKLIDAAPSPETIGKFAQGAYNGVTYEMLMQAAGHIIKETDPIESVNSSWKCDSNLEKEFLQILISELYQNEYEWTIEKSKGRYYIPDVTIRLKNSEYSTWYIELKSSHSVQLHDFYRLYGAITTLDLTADTKFSIAVDSIEAFDHLIKTPPISLRA
ncbi:hypothetical protein, partial [Stenotrophomonas maltophilia group sp. RNC7]|uniref:hypothetical protein n=1 Tax=Stenotrophomonas maltophilia group sp. RNC7 TaxID=3071467 RepID=UPI0027E07501